MGKIEAAALRVETNFALDKKSEGYGIFKEKKGREKMIEGENI